MMKKKFKEHFAATNPGVDLYVNFHNGKVDQRLLVSIDSLTFISAFAIIFAPRDFLAEPWYWWGKTYLNLIIIIMIYNNNISC